MREGGRGLVVIPTYNEAANLTNLVPQVLAQDPRLDILIVDDNSPDGTGQLAEALRQKEPRLSVIHREGKLGLGTAYIAGFRWALERRSEEHTSELQSQSNLVCRLLLEKKKTKVIRARRCSHNKTTRYGCYI